MKTYLRIPAMALAALLSCSPLSADPPYSGDFGNSLDLNSGAVENIPVPPLPRNLPVGVNFNITMDGRKARVNIARRETEIDVNAIITLAKFLSGGGVTPDTVVTTAELSWKLLKAGAASADSDVMLVNVLPPGRHWSQVEGWSEKPAACSATITMRNNSDMEPAAIKYIVSAYYNGHHLHGITVVPAMVSSRMWNNQPRLNVSIERVFNAGTSTNLIAAAIIKVGYYIGGPLGKAIERDDRYIVYADGRIGPYYDSVAEAAAKRKADDELNRLRANAREAGMNAVFSGSPYALMVTYDQVRSVGGTVFWRLVDHVYNPGVENFPSLAHITPDQYTGRWDWAPSVDPDIRYVITVRRSVMPGYGTYMAADSANINVSGGITHASQVQIPNAYASATARLERERDMLVKVGAFLRGQSPEAWPVLRAAYRDLLTRYNEELNAVNIMGAVMTQNRDFTVEERNIISRALPEEWMAMNGQAGSPWIGSAAPRESSESLMTRLTLEHNRLSLGNEQASISVGLRPGSLNNDISVRVGQLTVKYVPDMPAGILAEAQLLQRVDDLRKDIIDTTRPAFASTANDAGFLSVLPEGKSGSDFRGWRTFRQEKRHTFTEGSVISFIIEGEYNGQYLRRVRAYANTQIYARCQTDEHGIRPSIDCPLKSKVTANIVYNHTPMNRGTAERPVGALLFMLQRSFRRFPAQATSATDYYMLRADGTLLKQETPF